MAQERAHKEGSRLNSPALALLGVAPVVLAVSVLVGFVGSPETRFSWELASIFGTGLGTTLLALATGWLAFSTRDDVRATQELAELTREDQAARDRPVVMVEYWNHEPGKAQGLLQIHLLNVGLGPALRVRLGATYIDDESGGKPPKITEVTVPAIPPNERATPELSVSYPAPGWAGLMTREFRITGTYEDRAGRGEYAIEQPIVELTQRTTYRL